MYSEEYLEKHNPRCEVATLFNPVFIGEKGDEIDWEIYFDLFQRTVNKLDRTNHCTIQIFDRFQEALVEAGGILTRSFNTGKIFWICQEEYSGYYSCIYFRSGRFVPRQLYVLDEKIAWALLKAAEKNKGISRHGKVYLWEVIDGKAKQLN